jgi:hypothetical protein
MPNLTGYEETENPGWINVKFDDGTSQHVNDPTGMFRGQISEVAAKLNPTPTAAPPIASAPAPEPAFVAPPQPQANAIFTPPSPAPVATPGPVAAPVVAPPPPPVPVAPIAAPPPVAGVAPAAPLAPMKAAPGMRMSGQRRSVTGLAEEDKQVIDSANADAMGARVEADDAAIQARTNQLQAEWDGLTAQEKSKLAEDQLLKDKEARFTAKLDAQMKRNQEITDRPIDGAKAFDGDAGWYAFMAAMGEAVSDFGRAMLGQPARGNPAEVIDRIMQNSIRSQTELKQEQLKQGRITVEQFDAERERIRLNITTAAKQLAELQAGKAKNEIERLGTGALAKKFTAEQKDAIAKNAMATARQETREEAFAPPVAGGVVDSGKAIKDALELDKAMEERGYTKEQRAAALASLKMPTASGKSAPLLSREDSDKAQSEKEALAEGAVVGINRLATKAGLRRNPNTGEWEEGEGLVAPAVAEKALSTVTMGVAGTPIQDELDMAAEAYGRWRSGGVISDDSERPQFYEQMGKNTLTRAQLASKLNAAEASIQVGRPKRTREKTNAAPKDWK